MKSNTSVLLVDDGELTDVHAQLQALGAACVRLRGGAIPERIDPPRDLLITTARRAGLSRGWPASTEEPPGPTRIAVLTEDSNAARQTLRELGFDFLIRRPVHPEALRLLLLRCLYTGDERRRHPRSPIGREISFRSGLWNKKAILADLSLRGASLLSSRPLPLGTEITLQIPRDLLPNGGSSIRARVVRAVEQRPPGARRQFVFALEIDPNDARSQLTTQRLLEAVSAGPPAVPGAVPSDEEAVSDQSAEARLSRTDRRQYRRAQFEQRVNANLGELPRVLIGRDLSEGGMRIDPDPDLQPGQELQLEIYGSPDAEPFVVTARVLRNEGERGVGLAFEKIDPETARGLEALVAHLPSVESLHEDEVDSMGTVVSRILDDETGSEL